MNEITDEIYGQLSGEIKNGVYALSRVGGTYMIDTRHLQVTGDIKNAAVSLSRLGGAVVINNRHLEMAGDFNTFYEQHINARANKSMGIRQYTSIIWGYRVKIVPHTEEVTKYNPDTGVPYQTKVELYKKAMIGDRVIGTNEQNTDAFWSGETLDGLTIASLSEDNTEILLGASLPIAGHHGHNLAGFWNESETEIKEFDPTMPAEVAVFRDRTGLEPKMYSTSSWS